MSSFWDAKSTLVLLRPRSLAQDSLSEQGPHLVVDEDTERQREVPSKGACLQMGSQSSVYQLHGPLGNRGPCHPLISLFYPTLLEFLLLICTLPPGPSLTLQVGY